MIRELYEGAFEGETDSGLRILVEEVPQSRSVSLGIWIRSGSRDDPEAAPGIAHFIEHLAFKGTASRDAAQISREIDGVGGNLNAATGRESTVFYSDVPAEGLDTSLDVLTDLVSSPSFTPESVELERTVILDEIRGHEDDPEASAFDRFVQNVWSDGSPLARPVLGTRTSLDRITREDVVSHHVRHYRPQEMIVAAAGALDASAFIDAVTTRLSPLESSEAAPRDRVAPEFVSGAHDNVRDGGQTHVYAALPGAPAGDPDRYALELVNVALGDGASSRLFRGIREERGLAYAVGSTLIRYSDVGLWLAYASTSPAHANEVRGLLESEIGRLAANGLDDAEIELARARLHGLFVLGMESNANRAMRLGTAAVTQRRILAPSEVLAKLDAVTADEVAAVIDRYVRPDVLHVTSVGPQAST